jgi:hypothetical protein
MYSSCVVQAAIRFTSDTPAVATTAGRLRQKQRLRPTSLMARQLKPWGAGNRKHHTVFSYRISGVKFYQVKGYYKND